MSSFLNTVDLLTRRNLREHLKRLLVSMAYQVQSKNCLRISSVTKRLVFDVKT